MESEWKSKEEGVRKRGLGKRIEKGMQRQEAQTADLDSATQRNHGPGLLQMLVDMDSELSLILKHLHWGDFWEACKRQNQEEKQHAGDEQTLVVPGRGTWSWPLIMHLAACATRASRSRANTARLVR